MQDISIVERDEDVVLQVSVDEAEAILKVNGRVETLQCYIGATSAHLRIPSEYIQVIDKIIDTHGSVNFPTQDFLTMENSLTPVWVGQTSIPFVVIPSTEADLERECADVVSNVDILLHNEWESFKSIRRLRNVLQEFLKTK